MYVNARPGNNPTGSLTDPGNMYVRALLLLFFAAQHEARLVPGAPIDLPDTRDLANPTGAQGISRDALFVRARDFALD
jgi:hypothetical protein